MHAFVSVSVNEMVASRPSWPWLGAAPDEAGMDVEIELW